uniref:LigA n=1 Tax=Parastrongyloides trichosuri TaxID=131310 RepID=A0A0N4ZL00_PARTI
MSATRKAPERSRKQTPRSGPGPPERRTGTVSCGRPSVADGEAGAGVLRRLDLVGHGDGVVGEGDAAVPLVVRQQGVAAQAEDAGALRPVEQGRGRQKGPVQLRLGAQGVQEPAAGQGFGLIGFGEGGRVDQALARRDLQAAGAADHQITRNACILDRLDQQGRIAVHEHDGADHGVGAGQGRGERGGLVHVACDSGHAGSGGHALPMGTRCAKGSSYARRHFSLTRFPGGDRFQRRRAWGRLRRRLPDPAAAGSDRRQVDGASADHPRGRADAFQCAQAPDRGRVAEDVEPDPAPDRTRRPGHTNG